MASRKTKPEVGCLGVIILIVFISILSGLFQGTGHGEVVFGTFVAGLVIVLILVGLAKGIQATMQADRVAKARERYQNALEEIRQNSPDPDARQRALQLGRAYFRSASPDGELTVLHETQIMNEINVASSQARTGKDGSMRVTVTNAPALSGVQLSEEIKKLGDLFMKGYLTAEEFERGKAGLLGAPEDKAAAAVDLLQNLSHLKAQGVLSDSEFNMKKWEILSERLLPGRGKAASMPQSPPPG